MRRRRLLRRFIFTGLALWAFWLILTDNAGLREMLCGAAATAVAITVLVVFVLRTGGHFTVRWEFLKESVHIPKQLLADTGTLLLAVARRMGGARPPSGILAVPFRRGGNRPTSRARRAFAITYLTTTPNTLVLGILEQEGLFLFHTIVPKPFPQFMVRLGAEPEREVWP